MMVKPAMVSPSQDITFILPLASFLLSENYLFQQMEDVCWVLDIMLLIYWHGKYSLQHYTIIIITSVLELLHEEGILNH